MDNGWLGRLLQVFGPLLAAWSAFLAFLVHLKKLRNSEQAAAHGRFMAEYDRVCDALNVVSEERDLVRDKNAVLEVRIADLMQENATLKGYRDGIGNAKNEAQRFLSEEREAMKRGNGDDA